MDRLPPLNVVFLAILALIVVVALVAAARVMFRRTSVVIDRLRVGSLDSRQGLADARRQTIIKQYSRLDSGDDDNQQTLTRVQKMLVHANITHPNALRLFLAAKIILAIALPLVFLLVNLRLTEPIDMALAIALALAIFGLFLPNFWLGSRVRARQLEITRALPDALDLLVTCVEAGLGLDAALSRVAEEIRISSEVLADEFQTTFLEIGAGLPRVRAFRRLADRTGVDDVRSLSATLTQTERFGTSVATALRIRADWMRTRRMQVAEEKAAVVSVKMTIPLVLCILPSLIAVIMGPAVVKIASTLLPHFGNAP